MKISRNDACPCGSGRKYKKCCLATRVEAQNSSFEYDADIPPDPAVWNALSKPERIRLIEKYHGQSSACYGDLNFHSFVHSLVEELVTTDGLPSVASAFQRLQMGGIRRHQAIHAIASKLGPMITKLWESVEFTSDEQDALIREYDEMTAGSWIAEKQAHKCSDPDHASCGHPLFADH